MNKRVWRQSLWLVGLSVAVGLPGCKAPNNEAGAPAGPAAPTTSTTSAAPAQPAPATTSAAQNLSSSAPLTRQAAPVMLPRMGDETSHRNESNYQAALAAPIAQPAAPTATPLAIRHETVTETVDGVPVAGYLAQPAGEQPKAALLLIHEWWGLTPAVERQADWLAGLGYKTLAVDLYGGKTAKNRGEAASLIRQVKPEEAQARLKAAATLLARNGNGPQLKVGAIGWGYGGGLAVRLAAAEPSLAAVVVYYGELPRDPAELARLKTPMLGLFAANDAWITPARVAAFEKTLLAQHTDIQTFSFSTASGFALTPQNDVDKAYAETARERTTDFLARHLQ